MIPGHGVRRLANALTVKPFLLARNVKSPLSSNLRHSEALVLREKTNNYAVFTVIN